MCNCGKAKQAGGLGSPSAQPAPTVGAARSVDAHGKIQVRVLRPHAKRNVGETIWIAAWEARVLRDMNFIEDVQPFAVPDSPALIQEERQHV